MKNKHRIKQGLSLLLAGGIALTNLGAALPAFAEDAAATPETAQTATLDPDAAVLYADLPDAPAGSYIGSEGLPVATGQTKISLSLWADGQLEQDSHLDPDALNSGDKTVTVPLTEDTDYAIVPLMAQVEYPADGSRTDVLLPENVTLLVGIGLCYLNINTVIETFTLQYLLLCLVTCLGAFFGAAIVGKLVGFYPVESGLTAGLCMANMGGTGDVAVLSAANRMELMPFAQISSRLGGAIILLLGSLLLSLLGGML